MGKRNLEHHVYVNVASTLTSRANEARSVGDHEIASGYIEIARRFASELEAVAPEASVRVEEIVFEAELNQIQ